MTKAELKQTIDWLQEWIFRMEDRDDAEKLRQQVDRLKDETRKLEDRYNAL